MGPQCHIQITYRSNVHLRPMSLLTNVPQIHLINVKTLPKPLPVRHSHAACQRALTATPLGAPSSLLPAHWWQENYFMRRLSASPTTDLGVLGPCTGCSLQCPPKTPHSELRPRGLSFLPTRHSPSCQRMSTHILFFAWKAAFGS